MAEYPKRGTYNMVLTKSLFGSATSRWYFYIDNGKPSIGLAEAQGGNPSGEEYNIGSTDVRGAGWTNIAWRLSRRVSGTTDGICQAFVNARSVGSTSLLNRFRAGQNYDRSLYCLIGAYGNMTGNGGQTDGSGLNYPSGALMGTMVMMRRGATLQELQVLAGSRTAMFEPDVEAYRQSSNPSNRRRRVLCTGRT